MSLLLKTRTDHERQLAAELRPHLRPRAERLADPTRGLFSRFELACAIWKANGDLSKAQRLLVRASGCHVGRSHVVRKVSEDAELSALVQEYRLKAKVTAGKVPASFECPHCHELIDLPKPEKADAVPEQKRADQRGGAWELRDQLFAERDWSTDT